MDRFLTPPSSPSLTNLQIPSPSPRRLQSPRRKSNVDTTIENWMTLSNKIDDILTINEAQEEISDHIISTLRTELLKELEKTSWMYNDYSYT